MILAFGAYEVDDELFELRRDKVPVPIQRKTFDLLAYLARSSGAVVPREQLLRDVWPDVVVSEPALTQALSTVRKAIGDDRADPRVIKTVRGRGYRFAVEVTKRGGPPEVRTEKASEKPPSTRATPLVGRDARLRHLEGAAAEARAGRGRIVLVTGEQGIGKTRLVEALEARGEGLRFAKGFGFPGVGAPPLWPWVQIDRRLGGGDKDAQIDLEDAHARFRYADAIVQRIVHAAKQAPLAIVLEDAHWIDEASLDLVQMLAPELASTSLLLVVTSRSANVGPLGALARLPRASTLELGRLERADVATLIASLTHDRAQLGEARGDAVIDRVLEKTGGLPWLVVQIGRVLANDAAVSTPGTSVMLHTGAVREAIAQQIAGLAEPVRRALTVASVLGTTFVLGPLARVLDTTPDALLTLLDIALAERVIARGTGNHQYRFTQPLLRDALYRNLPDGDRMKLHAKVGRTLRDQWGADADAHASEIAPHLLEAGPLGDVGEAVRVAILAFESCLERGDRRTAEKLVLLARAALEHAPKDEAIKALHARVERAGDQLRG